MRHWIEINRAPVLTLWAAVVAERLGFNWEEALTLGRAVAGLNAHSKGKALGLFEPTPEAVAEKRAQLRRHQGAVSIDLLHRKIPAIHTDAGIRALQRAQGVCSLPPMAAAAMVRACVCGNANCRNSPMNSA